VERRGTPLMRAGAGLLFAVAPFAVLQPLGIVCKLGDYSRRYDWLYLALSLTIAWLSQARQRRSFYLAGVLNTGWALWVIADHNQWFDQPRWAVALIVSGLLLLLAGFELARRERRA
jgi:hypothetical protein